MTAASLPVHDLLQQCKGRPVRISLFDSVYRDRLGRYPGVLADVLSGSLVIECLDAPVSAPPGTSVTLELVRDGQIHWCHSQLLPGWNHLPHRLMVAWPEHVQMTQYRTAPRIDTYIPVHYSAPNQETAWQGVLINLSAGGAALQGSTRLDPGTKIALIFALGSGLHFQDIVGEVLRTTGTRSGGWTMGLRFADLTAEQQARLSQWVGYHVQTEIGWGK